MALAGFVLILRATAEATLRRCDRRSCLVNEELRRRLDGEFGSGYDYTYLFPGIRKVVQAAGRVIRTPSDRGVLHLIDDRFARPEVLRLLPTWWRIDTFSPKVIAAPRLPRT